MANAQLIYTRKGCTHIETGDAARLAAPTIVVNPLPVILSSRPPCEDLDDDCKAVRDKRKCHEHDPGKGYCPFLVGRPE
jgi:hypothetical protein